MRTVKMPVEFNDSDVDFLACSIAYMEISGRDMKVENVAGNMTNSQKKRFYERLEFYRTELLEVEN